MNQREIRGSTDSRKNDQITRIEETHYLIKCQSRNTIHDVMGTKFGRSCSCEDHNFRKIYCKHIHAVEILLRIRREVKSKVVLDSVNINCINCRSNNIIKRGIRKNKTHAIQIYSCKNCNKKFSINLRFEKIHASLQIITSAMQLYFTGESLRGVQKFLQLQCQYESCCNFS